MANLSEFLSRMVNIWKNVSGMVALWEILGQKNKLGKFLHRTINSWEIVSQMANL